MNSVQLIGRITRNPAMKAFGGSGSLCELRLAFSKNTKGETGYIDVTVWGASAQACGKYLQRGDEIAVYGSLDPQEWTNADGTSRRVTKVKAHGVDFLRKANQPHDPTVAVVELDTDPDSQKAMRDAGVPTVAR